ncbi:MAG: Mor transcription activator family protein [Pseudomonadota bacterium]
MALADTRYLERLIGREALETLIQTCGGLSIQIPKRPPMAGPLLDLPLSAQEALARVFGGTELYVPKCDGATRAARNAAIRAAYDGGARVADLARQYRLTERQIWNILGSAEEPDLQGTLF